MRRFLLHLSLVAAAVWAAGCGQGMRKGGDPSSGQQGSQGLFYNVTVAKPYGGVVTSDDGQINCGTLVSQNACTAVYLWAATPTLSAATDANYSFTGWAGDCSGTGSCVLGTAASGADKTVAAVFQGTGPNAPPAPPPDQTPGRLYGYVLSTDATPLKVAGVSVTVDTVPPQTAKTSAGGAFVFEVPPGTYALTAAAGAGFAGGANAGVVVPRVGGAGCVQGFYVPTAPYTQAGCLVQSDISGAYTAPPVAGPNPFLVTAPQYLKGFGQPVTINCDANGYPWASWRWVQTKGPTAVALTPGAGGDWTFTTPTIQQLLDATAAADVAGNASCPNGAGAASGNAAVGCGVSNFYMENRPRLVNINKVQADELTYTFACEIFDGPGYTGTKYSKTTTVNLATKVNANRGNFVQNVPALANGAARVPAGALVIADDYRACEPGETPTAWPYTSTSEVICRPVLALGPCATFNYGWALSTTTTGAPPVPTLNDACGKNPWVVLPAVPAGLASVSWTLTDDAYTDAAFSFTEAASWASFEDTCNRCHGPATELRAPPNSGNKVTAEVVAEWKASKHNHIVVDGMSGTHYSSSCLPCHSVGYEPGLANGGWDDVAAAQVPPYKLPDFTFLGADASIQLGAMPAAVRNMSNIQCQNCHGPAVMVGTSEPRAHTASASAKVCAACHDGGHHGIYSQWRKTGHANLELVIDEGPLRGASQTHCARCHYAQGNAIYQKQLAALGNPDQFDAKIAGSAVVTVPIGSGTVTVAAGGVSKAARGATAGNVAVTVTLPAGTVWPAGSQTVNMTFTGADVGTIVSPNTWPTPGPFTSGNKSVTVDAAGTSFTYNEAAAANAPAVLNVADVTLVPAILPAGGVSKAARTQTTAGNVTVTVTLPPAATPLPVGTQYLYLTFTAPDLGTIADPVLAPYPAPGPFTSGAKIANVATGGMRFTYSEGAAAGALVALNAATVAVQPSTFPQPSNVTVNNVETIGCATCHNPHSLEMTITNAQTQGTGLLLAGGFRATNAGAGGVCVMCHNSRNGMISGVPTQHKDSVPLTSANFGMTAPHAAAQADVYYAGNGYLLGTTAPAEPNYHQDPNWFPDTCAECHVKRFTAATQGKTVANHTFKVDANTCVSCHGAGVELSYREAYVNDRLLVYKLVLAQVLKGAGITAVGQLKTVAVGGLTKPDGSSIVTATLAGHGYVNGTFAAVSVNSADSGFRSGTYLISVVDASTFTFNDTRANATGATIATNNTSTVNGSFDVTGLGALTAAEVTGERPLTLKLTFGPTVLTASNVDFMLSGTTPTLYSGSLSGGTRTYGKVAKSMYNWGLITLDASYGVHNIPWVDAMLAAMIDPANYAPVGGVY